MHVESNSMNVFHTEHPLSAYGFSIYVVPGYQQDDPLFQHGDDGKPIYEWGYGVVVRGSKSAVEAKFAGSRGPAARPP